MSKYKLMLAIFLLISLISVEAAENIDEKMVKIYLPRQSQIDSDIITLSDIAVVHGTGQLADDIRKVTLGRVSMLGQTVVLNRETITGRLASSGFKAGSFEFLGAEEVSVSQNIGSISAQKIIEAATAFINIEAKNANIHSIEPLTSVNDLVIKNCNDLQLRPKLLDSSSINRIKVAVEIVSQGKIIATPEVTFGLKYKVNRIVNSFGIAAGQAISADNTTIQEEIANFPEADQAPLFGLVAKRDIPQGTVLRANMLMRPVPEIIVERNQPVIIKSQSPGLIVTATGIAMDKASAGQCIRVRNIDSQRIIVAKVNEDGTVEPVR